MVDEHVAHEVADAYIEAPRVPTPLVRSAYAQLAIESDELFEALTSGNDPASVRVVFTRCPIPYDDAAELIASIGSDQVLEVVVSAVDDRRAHPLFDSSVGGTFDRFRAVHDVLGHGRLGIGFDRHSEYATWRFQELFHSELARRALATELHAKHSARWTTGDVPDNRAVLLDEALICRARQRCRTPKGLVHDRAATHSTPRSELMKGQTS